MVFGECCGIRLYRFSIIVFSSTLVELKLYYMIALVFLLAILNFDNFLKWHTGSINYQTVNIKLLVMKHSGIASVEFSHLLKIVQPCDGQL